ncbi:hypothetical protein AB4076_00290 [Dyella sp. 2RAF44]|uniref:hypothetical protein n=1 Tax=Dyella sp. 2RAF44 TaxID=3233000 RepID=UPI003F91A3FA
MQESPTLTMLVKAHGLVLTATTTAKFLGFPSTDALRMARRSGRLPIEMFAIEGRRGWFSSARDVAQWLDQTTPETRKGQTEVTNSKATAT